MVATTPSEIAKDYARRVVAGKVLAGEFVRLACQRFLDDLKRKGKDWPYAYDAAKADRAVKFMQLMPHTKGKWAAGKQKLIFQPWQCFIECNLFGWVHKASGLRRFRESYEEVPRKNGKSLRLAARGLYLFAADGEAGAEVYSGATSEKQAYEVYRPAWQMVHKMAALRSRFGIEQSGNPKNPGTMYVMEDMSKFEPLIGKPGDGSSPHAALVDEYHEHDTDHMVDAMQTGMGAREQPLLSIITTAGSNLGGPCYEKRRDVIRILRGEVADETIFGIIYALDEGDRWDDPASLIKANPNYGISVFEPFLLAQLAQAKRSASKQNAFRTKHLNDWVGAKTAWMNMLAWQRQKRSFSIEDFEGCRCYAGVDLASKLDVAAAVLLFERDESYYAIPRFYVPESAVQENERYQNFVLEGVMVATPGDMTDYAFIEEDLKEFAAVTELQNIAFDPAQAAYLMTRLDQAGLPVVEMAQTVRNLSEPMKEVEALTIARRLWHDGNSAMTWMMGNVVARLDAKDNIYPRKETAENKIDGALALILAMALALQAKESTFIEQGIVALN
ncbi:terminase large subunit [Xanthomonas sontii]|uniref:Terminase large subunit n=1 Tax=Xanthomonas sontii TaxID=2650745 RepID=A0A6N7Q7F9_9XANT|nr:terminase TerL endonuclease subunit [Xanthomonas sontii]MRG98860.1 terminase large subunit [Xanthomonas sontii]MRH73349.1 terminase large subunit [Xanthomonas sontii]